MPDPRGRPPRGVRNEVNNASSFGAMRDFGNDDDDFDFNVDGECPFVVDVGS